MSVCVCVCHSSPVFVHGTDASFRSGIVRRRQEHAHASIAPRHSVHPGPCRDGELRHVLTKQSAPEQPKIQDWTIVRMRDSTAAAETKRRVMWPRRRRLAVASESTNVTRRSQFALSINNASDRESSTRRAILLIGQLFNTTSDQAGAIFKEVINNIGSIYHCLFAVNNNNMVIRFLSIRLVNCVRFCIMLNTIIILIIIMISIIINEAWDITSCDTLAQATYLNEFHKVICMKHRAAHWTWTWTTCELERANSLKPRYARLINIDCWFALLQIQHQSCRCRITVDS